MRAPVSPTEGRKADRPSHPMVRPARSEARSADSVSANLTDTLQDVLSGIAIMLFVIAVGMWGMVL